MKPTDGGLKIISVHMDLDKCKEKMNNGKGREFWRALWLHYRRLPFKDTLAAVQFWVQLQAISPMCYPEKVWIGSLRNWLAVRMSAQDLPRLQFCAQLPGAYFRVHMFRVRLQKEMGGTGMRVKKKKQNKASLLKRGWGKVLGLLITLL